MMKKYGIILIAFIASVVFSCTEVIKPEEHEVPGRTPDIDGLWAPLDELDRTDFFVSFYMGKYFSYTCGGVHVVDNNSIWNCSRDDCLVVDILKYSVSDKDLFLDGEKVGEVSFNAKGVAESLTIRDKEYTKFENFTEDSHVTETVTGVNLDVHSLSLVPGGKARLTATVLPEISFERSCTWKSSTPSVATVDNEGMITALNPGETEISVTTKVGGHTDFCHVIVNTDLSVKGRANCYIVPSSGWFSFDAGYKGGSDETIDGGAEAIVLWCTSTALKTSDITLDSFIAFCSYNKDNKHITFYSTGKDGNVVVALRDKTGKILWSWHLWVCKDFDPDLTAQTYYNDAGEVMDRNLGALTLTYGNVSNFGLSYQWGRKDPFPGSPSRTTSKSGTVDMMDSSVHPDYKWTVSSIAALYNDSVEHPTYFYSSSSDKWYNGNMDLWSTDEKSVYDPCPAGWRVMAGGPEGVLAKALGITGNTVLPNFTFDYYKDAMNLHSVAGDADVIWYQYIGRMSQFEYNAMGWTGYYWTRTFDTSRRKPYCFHIDRNGPYMEACPKVWVDETMASFYACPVRCEKEK